MWMGKSKSKSTYCTINECRHQSLQSEYRRRSLSNHIEYFMNSTRVAVALIIIW